MDSDDLVRAPSTPLAVRPQVSRHEAGRMLMSAIEGLELDWVDRSLLVRADAVWDPADMVILASLLERARQAGPAATPAVAPTGPGWVMTCGDCGLRGIGEPATLPEAESLCRTHDIVHHGGAWTAQAVEVVGSTR